MRQRDPKLVMTSESSRSTARPLAYPVPSGEQQRGSEQDDLLIEIDRIRDEKIEMEQALRKINERKPVGIVEDSEFAKVITEIKAMRKPVLDRIALLDTRRRAIKVRLRELQRNAPNTYELNRQILDDHEEMMDMMREILRLVSNKA